MKKTQNLLLTLALGGIVATPAYAAVSADEAARLGKDLTPTGAERAANAAGTIPEWTGGIKGVPDNVDYKGNGSFFPDPFADDKVLFEINKDNVGQYKDNLTEGQIAMFNKYPDTYRMPVYQTRRTSALPQWIYDNIAINAVEASITPDGNGIINAYGGLPFPMPQSGLEAIWNHTMRYQGSTARLEYQAISVQSNGKYTIQGATAYQMSPFYVKDGDRAEFNSGNNDFFLGMYITNQPARKNGEVILLRDPINQAESPRKAWLYLPGQRRVRRAPSIAYDTPSAANNGTTTYDDAWLFNGAPDRYDWNLIGKQELYIPYNNYKLDQPAKYTEVIQKGAGHLNPDKTRFELHRVWVVEATLKDGKRHIYGKRKFYIDEDSWIIAIADNYDTRGELWRHNSGHSKNVYALPGTIQFAQTYIDLNAGTMATTDMHNEQTTNYFMDEPMNQKFFTPGSVRKLSKR